MAFDIAAAVHAAKPGQPVQVPPGDYGHVTLHGLNFPVKTWIIGQPGAKVQSIDIANATNLGVSGLEVAIPVNGKGVNIGTCSGITLQALDIHGTGTTPSGSAIYVQSSKAVAVMGSLIHDLWNGIYHFKTTDLTIASNEFEGMGMDCVRGGAAWGVCTISENYFHDAMRNPGVHADAIQFWTSGTAGMSAGDDIRIDSNVIDRGATGRDMQGVFVGNEIKNPYAKVTITNNAVYGGLKQGIAISVAKEVHITGNDVVPYSDQDSIIDVISVQGGEVTGNSTANPPFFQTCPAALVRVPQGTQAPRLAAKNGVLIDPTQVMARLATRGLDRIVRNAAPNVPRKAA